jgi:hypothetical protein
MHAHVLSAKWESFPPDNSIRITDHQLLESRMHVADACIQPVISRHPYLSARGRKFWKNKLNFSLETEAFLSPGELIFRSFY